MKAVYFFLSILVSVNLYAQNNFLRCHPNINLPKDSLQRMHITKALEDFLIASQKSNEENKLVYEPEKLETFLLINELKSVEKSSNFKDDHFYKPYLTNLVYTIDSNYIVQVSYIGVHSDSAYLKASFRCLAHKSNSSYTFSSMLLKNTSNWKNISSGNIYFHYKSKINKSKVKQFFKTAKVYDLKLKIKTKIVDYYCFKDVFELQNAVGIDYFSDYNGSLSSVSSATLANRRIVLLGNNKSTFDNFDKHDLWHDRMSLVLPRSKANKSIDEGCAYLYGGSWGLSWDEIYQAFKVQIANNKNSNWIEIKENPVFFKTKEFNNSADYIISSLLIEKIEKEKGFEGVWEMLIIGPSEKGSEKFYLTLERLLGIKKENYNEYVWNIINNK